MNTHDALILQAWKSEAEKGDAPALRAWTEAREEEIADALGVTCPMLERAIGFAEDDVLCRLVIEQVEFRWGVSSSAEGDAACAGKPVASRPSTRSKNKRPPKRSAKSAGATDKPRT